MRRVALRGMIGAAMIAVVTATLALRSGESPLPTTRADGETVRVQILAVNDLHGGLEPTRFGNTRAGGVAALGAYLRAGRAREANTITVHAGDMIGGSPPISALLRDEPAMTALDLMGIEVGTVGNHEFDRGLDELYRLVRGGCDAEGHCFPGVRVRYLAANVIDEATGETIFPSFEVRTVDGVRIGFIGVTLRETGSIVLPSRVAGLRFLDEAEAVNRTVVELQAMGVRTIVVLLHKGGDGISGGVIEGEEFNRVVSAFDPEVDVVVSGHTHRGYRGTIDGRLVTQAYSRGTAFADIDLEIDRTTGDVVEKQAAIVNVFVGGLAPEPEPALVALLEQAAAAVRPVVERVVGEASEDILRVPDTGAEDAVANLVADAFRWATGADIGCVNAGGWRADILAGPVTWGELFEVQPFGNELVTLTLTGAQLERVLNQQWTGQPTLRIMRCSGLVYGWDPALPEDQRVTLANMFLGDGSPVEAERSYTVTVNNFLADGGHDLTVLQESPTRVPGPSDMEALVAYVEQLPQPFTSRVEGRLRTPPPAPPQLR
ncbi:MAG: bifunctional metallophosphatase/5'-nucleotidase [Dehalococcoidia bacterium]